MATKTDESVTGQKYTRQRSNSDPQPNLEEVKSSLSDKESKQKNGEVKTVSLGPNTPQPEKRSKFATFGKIFKPWKWKRKKKSEKLEKTAVELERKISVRSTREELIKKGVLKEPLDIKSSTVTTGQSIEQTSAEISNEQEITSTITVEQNHVDQNGTDTDKSEGTAHNSTGENVEFDTTVTTVADVSQFSTITTQADITPVSSSADTAVLTTAQARPMVFPTVPVSDKTEPVPTEITMETSVQVKEETSEQTSVADKPVVEKNNEVQLRQKHDQTDQKEQNEEDKEPEILYPEGFAPVPASEPDLTLVPKKSAMKGMGGGDNKPSTPNSVARDKNDNNSHVNFSHVDEITTPQLSNVIKQPSPKPSPKPTPLSSAMSRPKLRGGLAHFTSDSNKENIPIPVSMPTVPPTTSFQSTPCDDSSSDDEEIRYRDEEEDEEEEPSSLAAKVARQDSLAKFLSSRPSHRELVEKNIIHSVSDEQDRERRNAIGTALTRRLSLRPSLEELEQRNILHLQSSEEAKKEKEEKKRYLIRKLSFRPSIEELKERKIIQFSDYVEWTEAHEYDRRADKPWTRLTPKDKAAIRKELNEFKSKEMDVHEESKHLTRFHRP